MTVKKYLLTSQITQFIRKMSKKLLKRIQSMKRPKIIESVFLLSNHNKIQEGQQVIYS